MTILFICCLPFAVRTRAALDIAVMYPITSKNLSFLLVCSANSAIGVNV
uniref:Uncharacterized protein n=1 Tax=Arundo donax TaxID=35708 RepID=A0A0A9C9X3_ARUDO